MILCVIILNIEQLEIIVKPISDGVFYSNQNTRGQVASLVVVYWFHREHSVLSVQTS